MTEPIEELVNAPSIHIYYAHLWGIFLDLNQTRSRDMGMSVISYAEIKAYSDLMCIDLDRDDLRALMAIDRIYIEEMSKDK